MQVYWFKLCGTVTGTRNLQTRNKRGQYGNGHTLPPRGFIELVRPSESFRVANVSVPL